MKDAVKNPDGKNAKLVLQKLVPFLTCPGKRTVFGAAERNESAGKILSLGRRFSCAPDFLTFGIDDVLPAKPTTIFQVRFPLLVT